MAQHQASVIVDAPVHQVYQMFSHFNDYPKFMRHVKEVTYYDDQRSHWVVDVVGRHEWDATNTGWQQDSQIGWQSTDGLQNSGTVRFTPQGANSTLVEVVLNYNPPAGVLGDVGEALGGGKSLEKSLAEDLQNFARMVAEAPDGALDPESSNYLFNEDSAVTRGKATKAQKESMGQDAPSIAGRGQGSARESEARDAREAGRTGMDVSGGYRENSPERLRETTADRPREDWPNTTSPAESEP